MFGQFFRRSPPFVFRMNFQHGQIPIQRQQTNAVPGHASNDFVAQGSGQDIVVAVGVVVVAVAGRVGFRTTTVPSGSTAVVASLWGRRGGSGGSGGSGGRSGGNRGG